MTQSNRRTRCLIAAAVLALVASAAGDVDRTSLSQRYADFQKKQTQKWALATTTSSVSGLLGLSNPVSSLTSTVDRFVRYQIRLTTGNINPTNTPLFGDDFLGRQQQLDTLMESATRTRCRRVGT